MLDYITGTAVLEFGPAETLSPVGAISPAYARLCRPRHLSWLAHPREKPGCRPLRAISRERRTVCWRETDSNHRFLREFRCDVCSPWPWQRWGGGWVCRLFVEPDVSMRQPLYMRGPMEGTWAPGYYYVLFRPRTASGLK